MIEVLRLLNFIFELGILINLGLINAERLRKHRMPVEEILVRVGLGGIIAILAISGGKRLWSNLPADWSLPWLTLSLAVLFGSLAWTRGKQLLLRKQKTE